MATSYEVTDGTTVMGVFSSESKADALKKELKAQGVKARVRIVHMKDAKRTVKPKNPTKAPKKPVKAKKVPKPIPVPKDTPKGPQKREETPKTGSPKSTKVPKRADIDYSSCDLEQLADVLYEIQEAHVRNRRWGDNVAMSREGIYTVLTSKAAPGLCDTFLNSYIAGCPEYWRGWDEETVSYRDWLNIESRLNYIKEAALAQQARAEAPKEEPKKGILKRRGRKKTGLDARADFLKRMSGPLSGFGMDAVPLYEANFAMTDPAHICMIEFRNRAGESFFGLPDRPAPRDGMGRRQLKGIALTKVRDNMASYFDADGNPIAARLDADAGETIFEPSVPKINPVGTFDVDPVALKRELMRTKKIMRPERAKRSGRRRSGETYDLEGVRLYSRGGDLIMSVGENRQAVPNYPYGMRADVGDGEDVGVHSLFPMDYLEELADFMCLSDGPCTMKLDSDYPLIVQFTVGDWDVLAMLAPRLEE